MIESGGRERTDAAPLRRQLAIILVARMAVNTAHRIIYPFLPSLARGLGISLTAASSLVTARLVAGFAAPFLGPLSDRLGRRRTMEIALVLLIAASLVLVGVGTFAAALVAFGLYGLAKVLYDPAVHAYLGDTVPYRRRARAVGAVELAWSGAWLLGVPAAGFLIERLGWRAPWAALVAFGLLGLGLTRFGLPAAHQPTPPGESLAPTSLLRRWRELLRERRVRILLLTSALLVTAQELPFIVYGAWLEDSFGLSLSTLGLASLAVGLAEAVGELGTTLLTDRLGKKRSVVIGLLGLAAASLALPWLAQWGLVAGLGGVVAVVLAFEFAIVSLLPLATEVAPQARGSLLSLNITAMSLGRILGALSGGWLWAQGGGIAPNALAGAACALAAAAAVGWGLAEIGNPSLELGTDL